MKIRAKVILRNDVAMAAREALGLSQVEAAKAANVSPFIISELERMVFTGFVTDAGRRRLERIAALYEVDADLLVPPDLVGKSIKNQASFVKELPATALLEMAADAPSVEQKLIGEEIGAAISSALHTLPFRDREMVKLRYGFGGLAEMGFDEIGRIFRVGGTRVQQIVNRAIRKLQHPQRSNRIKIAIEGRDK